VAKLVLHLRRLPRSEPEPANHVVDLADQACEEPTPTPLARWSASVATAHDPCLVLDLHGRVLALSVAAAALLGCCDVGVIGRPLLSVVDVVDFDTGRSGPDYAPRVAPLAVLAEGTGLVRSLLRVRQRDGSARTLDASASPLHDVHGALIGSVTFLSVLG